jgi:cytosine permease
MSAPAHEPHLDLADEYEHEPVPAGARRSLTSVAAVWFGFPMNLGNAMFGGVIVYNLGTIAGLGAILLGNIVLFGYVGALSYIAGRTGKSFSLQAAATFGDRGRVVAAAFLATVVLGWFSFQIGLTGTTLQGALGWSAVLGAIVGGALYTGVTIVGIRALSWLGMIAAPLFIVLAVVALVLGTSHGGTSLSNVVSYHGAGTALSFGAAVSIVIAGFADSGTMTADFTRWSTSGRSAVAATFTAFPLANFVAYAIGGVVVAVGGSRNPATEGGGFLNLLTGHGTVLNVIAVAFVFINLGSVASHCLYNGAVGWSGITKVGMRPMAIALGLVGLVVAATGVWAYFLDWLNLLGIFVPPIGAVLIVDQLILRRGAARELAYRPTAFVAWALGAAAATTSHYLAPGSVDALVGIIAAAAGFAILEVAHGYAIGRAVQTEAA